jgi:hypothetical protein
MVIACLAEVAQEMGPPISSYVDVSYSHCFGCSYARLLWYFCLEVLDPNFYSCFRG